MRIGLLVDGLTVTRWQADALAKLGPDVELVIYNCTNAPRSARRLKHYPYYLVNLISLRSPLTRPVPFTHPAKRVDTVDFECRVEGAWQRLPTELIGRMNADRLDAVVKFGLGLLRIPEQLQAPILSYHHGDPRRFRGRPAGFYELLNGEAVLGQIVQVLSNELDAGRVVAYAETPVHRHSYRSTMREAYAVSPVLLGQALDAVVRDKPLALAPTGKVYRLPSASTVARFAGQRLAAKARRLVYGALIEKRWQVGQAQLRSGPSASLREFPPMESWEIVKRPSGYRFLADPFPHPTGAGILVEGLRFSTGLGEILQIDGDRSRTVLRGAGHFSYPSTILVDGKCYMTPEVCQWSFPRLVQMTEDGASPARALAMTRRARLVDPTLCEHHGVFYLFANDYSEGDFVLRLWLTETLDQPFREHPSSPIVISPRGGRMGGLLIDDHGLYRVGQNGSTGYGDGVLLFRVEELTPTDYRESATGSLRFSAVRGPHTLNFGGGKVLFDFYTDGFAPLAGFRRLRNRISSRSRDVDC